MSKFRAMAFVYYPNLTDEAIQWRWMTVTGPDAADFFHRLTTLHIRQLAVGEGRRGCFLSAQGKIRCFFTLWREGLDQFSFEWDAGATHFWTHELLNTIDQYQFSEKMQLHPVYPVNSQKDLGKTQPSPLASVQNPLSNGSGNWNVAWIFPSPEDIADLQRSWLPTTLPPDFHFVSLGNKPETHSPGICHPKICHHGSLDYGRPWWTLWIPTQTTLRDSIDPQIHQQVQDAMKKLFPKNLTEIDLNTLETWRIQQTRPRTDFEITPSANPLEMGLKDAIVPNKGCYPGQEVIERMSTKGSPPRQLVQIRGHGPLPPPQTAWFSNDKAATALGSLTSGVILKESPEDFLALGWVRKTHAVIGYSIKFLTHPHTTGTITRVVNE